MANANANSRRRLGLDLRLNNEIRHIGQSPSAVQSMKLLAAFKQEVISNQKQPVGKAPTSDGIACSGTISRIPHAIIFAIASQIESATFPPAKSGDRLVPIARYLHALTSSGIDVGALITASHYFDQIQQVTLQIPHGGGVTPVPTRPGVQNPLCDRDIFLRKCFVSCLVLACKNNYDNSPTNRSWVDHEARSSLKIGEESALGVHGNALLTLNIAEREILSKTFLDHNLNVSPSDLISKIESLENRIDPDQVIRRTLTRMTPAGQA
ncbi:MAG: hypothetical protein ACRYF5_13425 [Janthinobacterium lividum]